MQKHTWKIAAFTAALLLTMSAYAVLAADTATKAKSATKATEQSAPGCVMKGGAAKDACQPGCAMHGEMDKGCCKAGDMKGCAKHGDMKGCCKGDMKACAKHGDMKGCCKGGDMKACAMHGKMDKACAKSGGMKGCGSGHMAAGMPGCGMKGGMGPGAGCGPMGHPGMGPGMGCGPEMLKTLDLTPEQQKKVQAIHEKQARAMVQAQADLKLAEMDLQNLKRADSPDKAKIDAQIDRISQLRAGMEKSHMATMLEVRGVLTPEQLKKCQAGPRGCSAK